jgi:hypothetical protein
MILSRSVPLSLMFAFALSACGGGGNESGPPDRIQPSTTSIKAGSAGACALGVGPEIHLHGGQPPYRLSNSLPRGMQLNKDWVQNSGDSFVITFVNQVAFENMPITIEDRMGRLATVSVSNCV